jgi:FtsP/CotA-like multicopper oxidase with cupredoxin domain
LGVNMGATQTLDDGLALSVWSFGGGFNGDRAVPAPVIEAIQGQDVAITLSTMMPHTLHPHGLDVDQANDGVPTTSGFVGMAMPMMGGNFGRVQGLPSLGSSFTYRFVAPHAGTYAYHCHVDTVLHMEMGMAGTIIVRPSNGSANQAWDNGPLFDSEYIWHLHTFDSTWHGLNVSGPATVRYRPDYFLINGRSGSDLLADAATAVQAAPGSRVLVRVFNPGYLPARVSLGGILFDVIASDGRPLRQALGVNSLLVGPGERYDVLFSMPAGAGSTASIDYLDITGSRVRGTALTTITSI